MRKFFKKISRLAPKWIVQVELRYRDFSLLYVRGDKKEGNKMPRFRCISLALISLSSTRGRKFFPPTLNDARAARRRMA